MVFLQTAPAYSPHARRTGDAGHGDASREAGPAGGLQMQFSRCIPAHIKSRRRELMRTDSPPWEVCPDQPSERRLRKYLFNCSMRISSIPPGVKGKQGFSD